MTSDYAQLMLARWKNVPFAFFTAATQDSGLNFENLCNICTDNKLQLLILSLEHNNPCLATLAMLQISPDSIQTHGDTLLRLAVQKRQKEVCLFLRFLGAQPAPETDLVKLAMKQYDKETMEMLFLTGIFLGRDESDIQPTHALMHRARLAQAAYYTESVAFGGTAGLFTNQTIAIYIAMQCSTNLQKFVSIYIAALHDIARIKSLDLLIEWTPHFLQMLMHLNACFAKTRTAGTGTLVPEIVQSIVRTKMAAKARSSYIPKCIVCFGAGREIAFSPCGHMLCCSSCVIHFQTCPLCQKEIKYYLKIFLS